jgi:hypothetical protein
LQRVLGIASAPLLPGEKKADYDEIAGRSEIDRHRKALGAATRQAIEEVEDAQYVDVETGERNGASAA